MFDAKGDVHLALSLYQLPRQMSGADVLRYADRITAAARAATAAMDRSPTSIAPLTTV